MTDTRIKRENICDECGLPISICNAKAMFEQALIRNGREAVIAAILDAQTEQTAPDVVARLVEAARLRAENERLRSLLRDGCDFMAIEVEALKSGISINDEMRPGPEDQHTVDAINELEGWIDRAGRAAMREKEG